MEYTTIKIPKPLADAIDKAVKKSTYRNRSEFVIDASRRLLEQQED